MVMLTTAGNRQGRFENEVEQEILVDYRMRKAENVFN
jgi:hypothetical protein